MAYLLGTTGFFLAWIVALGGLSALQHKCHDDPLQFSALAGAGGILGPATSCRRMFRFPWFVLFLGVLPVLLDFLGVAARGAKGGLHLYSAAVPLYCLIANMLYNLLDAGIAHRAAARAALAGFAIAAAMALLQMVGGAMMGDTRNDGGDHTPATTTTTAAEGYHGAVQPGHKHATPTHTAVQLVEPGVGTNVRPGHSVV